jgi:hypothetical protein
MPNKHSIPPSCGIAQSPSTYHDPLMLKRIRFTLNQCLYLADLDVPVWEWRNPRYALISAADADLILSRVPRSGRTAMSIRRKVASELRAAELSAEVGK